MGNLKDPNSDIVLALKTAKAVFILKEELGTWPIFYYIIT